jgi:hypothetical protein
MTPAQFPLLNAFLPPERRGQECSLRDSLQCRAGGLPQTLIERAEAECHLLLAVQTGHCGA